MMLLTYLGQGISELVKPVHFWLRLPDAVLVVPAHAEGMRHEDWVMRCTDQCMAIVLTDRFTVASYTNASKECLLGVQGQPWSDLADQLCVTHLIKQPAACSLGAAANYKYIASVYSDYHKS